MDDKTRKGLKVCVDRVLARDMDWRRRLLTPARPGEPERAPTTRLAIIGLKRWQNGERISVSFLDGEAPIQDKVVSYARRWESYANLVLDFGDEEDADIRISFKYSGSWSYIGTDARGIEDPSEATMNFGWLDDQTPDEEYERVVLHEFGHALGAIHEHQSPAAAIPWDKEAVYDYYMGEPNYWTKEEVDLNLFTLYEEETTQYTTFDTQSIMLYPIPEELLVDKSRAVGWNQTLSQADQDFMQSTYGPVS